MRILVVNAGSSSLKLRLLGDGDVLEASHDLLPLERGEDAIRALRATLESLGHLDAVGHRVVHGGRELVEPVVVTDAVADRLAALTPLAPLHQPKSLAALAAVRAALPDVPNVACFDTAFHATMPEAATTYAVPREWRDRWPIRRFGFHGLSHAYAARRTAELLRRPVAELRIVTAHLGAGASLAAVREGRSIDTTMGFTPLEGLVMATRSGDVDPGLVLWLQEQAGLRAAEVSQGLEKGGGLLGLAGDDDMAAIIRAVANGEPEASLALDVYLHRLRKGIAAMAAALGGLDALTFTGGVGEHAPVVRRRAVDGLEFLGLSVEDAANRAVDGDAVISPAGSPGAVLVVEAREDLEIARQVRSALATR